MITMLRTQIMDMENYQLYNTFMKLDQIYIF